MREVDEKYYSRKKKSEKKPVGLIIVIILLLTIFVWMIYNFIIAVSTGQQFSFLGNSREPVRNIVVAGIDEGGYRTDLIMLCQINRKSGEVNILQIPRDTRIENKRNDKKINSAYFSGFDCMAEEIEQVSGIAPDDYILIGFDAFNEVIDAMGGVTVDVPVRMDYTDPVQDLTIDLEPGLQTLNGEEAQMFMRFRQNNDGTGYANGDIDRIEAQKSLYSAVFKKMFSFSGIIKAPMVFTAVKENCETNLGSGEIISLMRDVAAIGKDNIHFHTLPGEGKYIGGVSYFVNYKDETKALMEENFEI